MTAPRTRPIQALALLGAALVVSLLLAEFVARISTPAPPQVVELPTDPGAADRLAREKQRAVVLQRLGDSSRHIFVETPTGRRLRANARLRLRHFSNGRLIDFATNSLGYRNRELLPKSIFRVLFLGDSITGGDYLQAEETFVAQVERISWRSPRPVETINAGIGAIGLQNELAVLEETGLSTMPDAVVLGFYLNDLGESYGFSVDDVPGFARRSQLAWLVARALQMLELERRVHPAFGEQSLLQLREEIRERYAPGLGDPLRERAAFFRKVDAAVTDWGASWSENLWTSMAPLFVHFRRLADANGFQPLMVVFPVALQVRAEFLEDTPQRYAKRIAAELDIPVLDLLPILREADDTNALFYDHCHYTPAGNRLVAEAIWAFLLENARIPTAQVPPELQVQPFQPGLPGAR
jgi:lysophospholipase L1-like esterase